MKRIIFYAVTNGIDGLQKEEIKFASFDEEELKFMNSTDVNKNWNTLKEKIVDVEVGKVTALNKLNGIDKLLLGL